VGWLLTEEVGDERLHARGGEQDRGVVLGDQEALGMLAWPRSATNDQNNERRPSVSIGSPAMIGRLSSGRASCREGAGGFKEPTGGVL